jgi:hypothetical protein
VSAAGATQAVDWMLWTGAALLLIALVTTGPCYVSLIRTPSDLPPAEDQQASVIVAACWFLTLAAAGLLLLFVRWRKQR